jgi:hypothetical protein
LWPAAPCPEGVESFLRGRAGATAAIPPWTPAFFAPPLARRDSSLRAGSPSRAKARSRRSRRAAPPAKFARGAQSDDQRCKRRGGARRQHDAFHPPGAKGERQQNFRRPFMRSPRRARHRMAKRIGVRRARMSDDPLSVARCDPVSPSPSTWDEKAASVNRKSAIAARPSLASRVSDSSLLADRANNKAKDIASGRQTRDNAALN